MITINEIKIDAFVDFGNGFKFIVEDATLNEFGNLIISVNPNSIKWIELEHDLYNSESLRGYKQFLAEIYEAEDEFWKEIYEDIEADRLINENKENFWRD